MVTHALVTLAAVRKMETQRQQEDAHKDSIVPTVVDLKNWPKSMESLEQYVRGHWGVDGGPLGYVICCDLFLPASAMYPGYNIAGSKYDDHDGEIIS